MSNLFSNLVNKIKLKKTINNLDTKDEYVFSLEEIDSLKEENDKKIKDLKENRLGIKKDDELNILNVYKKLDGTDDKEEVKEDLKEIKEDEILGEDNLEEDYVKRVEEELEKCENSVLDKEVIEDTKKQENDQEISGDKIDEEQDEKIKEDIDEKDSYINLSKENQELIMNSWNSINNTDIDKDIIEGKDILSHNYNITYGDNAARFVHNIRKKYEIVICYLIGFNNEKNGIKNKIIFSDKIDNEWKYLENYIKLLEKIRNFKK